MVVDGVVATWTKKTRRVLYTSEGMLEGRDPGRKGIPPTRTVLGLHLRIACRSVARYLFHDFHRPCLNPNADLAEKRRFKTSRRTCVHWTRWKWVLTPDNYLLPCMRWWSQICKVTDNATQYNSEVNSPRSSVIPTHPQRNTSSVFPY